MRINTISIKNFKNFITQDFKFNPNFTVLIGDNAKGKTSALDAISVALGSYFLGIDGQKQRGIRKDEIHRITKDTEIIYQLPVIIEAKAELDNQQLTWKRTANTESGKLDEKYAKELKEIAKSHYEAVKVQKEVALPILVYYSTSRLWGNTPKKIDFKKKQTRFESGYQLSLEPDANTFIYLDWFKTQEYDIKANKKDDTLLQVFKQAITSSIENWKEIYFDASENDIVGTSILQDEEVKLPYRMLSDGQRNVIGLVAELAYRCIVLNGHLGKDVLNKSKGVILIDEIDLHLHPKWQRRIVGDLKRIFPNLQFIATTHSPFIVQSLKSDELINLDGNTDIEPQKQGIEEVAEEIMGVENAKRSEQYLKMLEKAEAYYKELETLKTNTQKHTDEVLQEKLLAMDKALEENFEDPAFVAFLKLQRLATQAEIQK